MNRPEIIIAGRHELSETGNNRTYTCFSHTLHFFDYAVRLTVDGRTYDLSPGDAAMAFTGKKVHYLAPEPSSHFCFHFQYDTTIEPELMPDFIVFRLGATYPSFLDTCSAIQKDFESGDLWCLRSAEAALYSLICQLHTHQNALKATETKSDLALKQAEFWIEENLHHSIQVEDVVAEIDLDQNYLARKFKQKHGKTIQQYIRDQRLERAYHWLTNTDLPIKMIAADLGFYDLQHFYRNFKSRYGEPPAQIRMNAGQK